MKTLSLQAIQSCTLPAYFEEGKRWFDTLHIPQVLNLPPESCRHP